MIDTKIYLASKSPRRQELLKLMGIQFEVLLKEVDESYPAHIPTLDIAAYISEKKAEAFKNQQQGLIITADTIVLIDDEILGKPKDAEDAVRMLEKLNGRMHQVITGVSLVHNHIIETFSATTDVYFRTLTKQQINHYIHEYQPFDKAGSYGIQEWIGLIAIEKINGSYTNVMGLPTEKLFDKLTSIGKLYV